MKKNIFSLIVCGLLLANNANAITVYDPAAASNAAKQIIEAKNQLEQLKAQVMQIKGVYQSLNGTRGIVNLLENPAVVSKLPATYQDLYTGIKNSKSGKWKELYQLSLDGKASKNANAQNLREAYDNSLKEYSYEIEKSFEYQQKRIKNLQDLSNKISLTKDPKEIADLQARINSEQAGIAIDKSNFELLKEVKNMREQALRQQASNQWHESLKKPFKMPDIHVDIKKPFSN